MLSYAAGAVKALKRSGYNAPPDEGDQVTENVDTRQTKFCFDRIPVYG